MREAVRKRFGYCSAYCGVSEVMVGSQLEIDHFRPASQGGGDELNNLVYACTTCNRLKSDYWPSEEMPDNHVLLHPYRDEISEHIEVLENGRLQHLTSRGKFHIQWLHLNRLQLVMLRQYQASVAFLQARLENQQTVEADLRQQIQLLEQEVSLLQEIITRLTQ
ncbi:MAG: HNH endonuclease signature motif containing protein [Chloroflexota bacterium]